MFRSIPSGQPGLDRLLEVMSLAAYFDSWPCGALKPQSAAPR